MVSVECGFDWQVCQQEIVLLYRFREGGIDPFMISEKSPTVRLLPDSSPI